MRNKTSHFNYQLLFCVFQDAKKSQDFLYNYLKLYNQTKINEK